jgi:hypothetical protein
MPTYPCSTFKTLQISFTAPIVPPANGYIIKWRPVGTTDWNFVYQNQNPIVIAGVPSCYNIEGSVRADCGDGNLGNEVVFAVSSTANGCKSYILNDNGTYSYVPCGQVEPVDINNLASSPTAVCAVEGTVTSSSGLSFTDLNIICIS